MRQYALVSLGVLLCISCREVVIRSQAGEFSRGTYQMLLAIYKDENREKLAKEGNVTLEQDFLEYLKTYEALGALALELNLERHEYYPQYLALQRKARYGKAAFAWWREKLGADFSFPDVFQYYQVKVNPEEAVTAILRFRQSNTSEKETILGHFQGGQITLADIRSAVTSVEYNTFIQLDAQPLKEALPEKIRAYLVLVGHNEMRHHYQAYESELQRWDFCHVADKFLRVKYGIAGKGIYPDEPLAIPITMEEIYDTYHKKLNHYAGLKAVVVEEYFCATEKEARELAENLRLKGPMLGKKYQQKRIVKAYKNPDDFREKENRNEADNVTLEAAYKNLVVTQPYRQGSWWVVGYISTFERSEEPSIEKYSHKIEQEIRLNLLRRQYEIDLSDKKEALKFQVHL